MNIVTKNIMALTVVCLTIGVLWFTNQAVTPKTASWEDVVMESRAGGYQLITTKELHERYTRDPNPPLIVDTRQDWEYRTGHIKDAVNFPMEPTWFSRWQKASSLEGFLGPDKTRVLVFY